MNRALELRVRHARLQRGRSGSVENVVMDTAKGLNTNMYLY